MMNRSQLRRLFFYVIFVKVYADLPRKNIRRLTKTKAGLMYQITTPFRIPLQDPEISATISRSVWLYRGYSLFIYRFFKMV